MNAAAQRRLTVPLAALGLFSGILLLALFLGAGTSVHWGVPRPAAPLPTSRTGTTLPEPLPLAHFAVVWQKPLFSPDRKPSAVRGEGGSALGDMQLTGIILTPSLHMALLRDKRGGEFRVREGDALPDGSWTLAEVKPRSALFDSASGRTELTLPAGAPIDIAHGAPAAAPDRAGAGAPGDGGGDSGADVPERNLLGEDPDAMGADPNTDSQDPGAASSDEPPAGADTSDHPDGGDGLAPRMGMPPPPDVSAGGDSPERPPQDDAALQAERIKQLKAIIRKRRAEQAPAAQEGDRQP